LGSFGLHLFVERPEPESTADRGIFLGSFSNWVLEPRIREDLRVICVFTAYVVVTILAVAANLYAATNDFKTSQMGSCQHEPIEHTGFLSLHARCFKDRWRTRTTGWFRPAQCRSCGRNRSGSVFCQCYCFHPTRPLVLPSAKLGAASADPAMITTWREERIYEPTSSRFSPG
jgi:hypothetical protein